MDLIYVSSRGETLSFNRNDYFTLINIDGLTTVATNISSSVLGGSDGDTVNNVQAQPRTIILDLRIKNNVENSKREILKIIKVKQYGALVWTQNDRTVTITGLIESIDMPRWNNGIIMQIAMHCEQPFWEDVESVVDEISDAIGLHYFTDYTNDMLYFPADGIPFGAYDSLRTKSFYNDGDVSVGMDIEMVALDTVTNPIIYNSNGQFFGVGYTGRQLVLEAGDKIKITTHRGNKTVTLNGVNIYDKIKPSSTWLQLSAGNNVFNISSDDESTSNMRFALIYKQKYI